MAAASHGTTASVNHEADQEPAQGKKLPFQRWQGSGELKSKTTMDTREEDDSHAVITVHPNKEEIEIKKRRARDKTRD